MKLDTFELLRYDENSIDHRSIFVELYNDEISRKYLGDLNLLREHRLQKKDTGLFDSFYIAYKNGEAVGVICLLLMDDKYEICYGILPKYRNQHLASLLLQEFTEKIFKDYESIDALYLQINSQNIASIKVADLVGFKKEDTTRYKMHR